jgi:hypothetical protein
MNTRLLLPGILSVIMLSAPVPRGYLACEQRIGTQA